MIQKSSRSAEEDSGPCKAAERVASMLGKEVAVRVSWASTEAGSEDYFRATMVDVWPIGKAYFYVFLVTGKRMLIQTPSVVSIVEL